MEDKFYLGSIFETQLFLVKDGTMETETIFNQTWVDEEDQEKFNVLVNEIVTKAAEKYKKIIEEAE